ncbi:MAG: hypothetical protein EAZ81_04000 [Verrucomicrobia bacterium]|nr:MAG: hypothetical protein EAZ81_04000 [Verrucomicrobiota bacterium]
MIENLRKYPGVIIAALVAVFIGFLLMDTERFFRQSGAGSIQIDGVTYDYNEFQRIGPSSLKLAQQLSSYQSMDLYRFVMALSDPKANSPEAAERSFFSNRLFLRQAAQEFGIHPGDEEVQTFLRERSVFADSDPTNPSSKKFNQESYQNFVMNSLGKSGMTEADLISLVRDMLAMEKIQGVLGLASEVKAADIKANFQAMSQKISLSYITLPLADYTKSMNPSEEELKSFWELRKEKYRTDVRRKFSYIIASPTYPKGAEKAPQAPKPAKEGEPAPEMSDADKKILEQRRKAELDVAAKMDDLLADIEENKGSELEKLAQKYGWSITKTDAFTNATIPDALLKLTPRKTTKTIQELLFDLKTTSDPISHFTSSFPVGEADWLIARLDSEEASREKSFAEAKEQVKAEWIDEKGRAALQAAAAETKKKIEEAMKAQTPFAKAASELKRKVQSLNNLKNGETPTGQSEAPSLFAAAQYVNPGSLTELVTGKDATYVALVEKREVEKDPSFDAMLSTGLSRYQDQMNLTAFQAWLAERRVASTITE